MKVESKTAKSATNKFVFNYAHGTTQKFFEPDILMCREIRKGSTATLKIGCIRRVDPMPLPIMSSVRFSSKVFYVPYIDICPYYHELDARTPYYSRYGNNSANVIGEIPEQLPLLETKNIKNLIFNEFVAVTSAVTYAGQTIGSFPLPSASSTPVYDDRTSGAYLQPLVLNDLATTTANYDPSTREWDIVPNQGVEYDIKIKGEAELAGVSYYGPMYFRFTERGRSFFKMLKQLGYDFAVTNVDLIKNGYEYKRAENDVFSAMKLLAYLKVYLDYYESAKYINNTTRMQQLMALLHIDKPGYSLSESDIDLIVDTYQYVTYDQDYFTDAFQRPSNDNEFQNNGQSIELSDNTNPSGQDVVVADSNNFGTAYYDVTQGNNVLTNHSLKLLTRLTQHLRRFQIAGGRTVDRILSEYGINIGDSYLRRTSYIDEVNSLLNVSPIMNTTSEQLGDYAGFGIAANNLNDNPIKINVPNEDGVIIVIDTAIPEIFYSQGYLAENRHIHKFDWLAGTEFDAVGTQSIEQGELLMSKKAYAYHGDAKPSELTFGFVPVGYESKRAYNVLTGDYIVNSINTSLEPYFTDRKIIEKSYLDNNGKINVALSRAFVSAYNRGQYERIFYRSRVKSDYIHSLYRIEMEMYAPYQSIYEEYKLGEAEGSNKVKMNVGGEQKN